MRHYLLAIYQPEGDPPPPDVLEPVMRELGALNAEIRDAGAWVFAGGLEPPAAATVLRQEGGEPVVTDGPFAETKEHLGGFTIVRAPDLDAALEWGRRLALATGLPVEVRAIRGGG